MSLFCEENGIPNKTFSADALELLDRQPWPGNVRELKNLVERAVILCDMQEISDGPLQAMLGSRKEENRSDLFSRPWPLSRANDELERLYVRTQLELHNWDIPATADVLGIQRTNLHRKIRQLGIAK